MPGIASVTIFGAGQYAMRIWVKPDTLAKLGVTIPEILQAIRSQNAVNPAGTVGGEPVPGRNLRMPCAQGRLQSAEEFGEIVVRPNPDGSMLRVKDVARIELGAQTTRSPAGSTASLPRSLPFTSSQARMRSPLRRERRR